jgi:hypothetical protein
MSAALSAPTMAHAAIGPKSLSFCDIAAWIGVVWVKECGNA